jgi:hypothetical protein
MTMTMATQREWRPMPAVHEAVCAHCGHGESLHPQRDLACLLCDQRAEVGLVSSFCVGFRSDRVRAAA